MREEKESLLFVLAKPFADAPASQRGEQDLRPLLQNIDNVLYLLLMVFLPTQFGRHFWLDDSLVAGLHIDYLSPTLYVTDLLIIFLFIATVFRKKTHAILSPIRQHKRFVILLFCAIIVNISLSDHPVVGLYGIVKVIEFVFFGIYTKYIFQRQRRNILLAFSIGMFFESIIAIFQFGKQSSLGGILYLLGERTFHSQTPGIANASIYGELILRSYGTFSHPNVLAGYLLIGIILTILYIRADPLIKEKKVFFIVTIFISSIALFTTLSRAAIFLWFISLISMLIVNRIRRTRKSGIIIWLIAAGILIFMFSTTLRGRISENIFTGESLQGRRDLIVSTLAIWQDHPLFGVGLNNFLIQLPVYHSEKSFIFYLQPVHNIFLLTLVEGGLVVFFFLIFFFWKTYRICRRHHSLLLFSMICILGSIDHYLFTLQQGQLLTAFVFGLLYSQRIKLKKSRIISQKYK